MTIQLTAQSLVDQVRQRASDKGSLIWTDRIILDAADQAFEHVWDSMRLGDYSAELDRMEVLAAAWTRVEELWYEYELPEYVGSIRRLEGITGAGDVRPIEVMVVDVDNKDHSRLPFRTNQPGWFRSKLGRPGKISFMGDIGSFTGARLWFTRRYPPLHFGVVGGGTTATNLVFDGSATGRVVRRPDLYVGVDAEFTSGTNVDQIRRITASAAGSATLASALPFTPGGSDTYSLVVPLESEHGEYFIETVTRRLLARLANTEHLAATASQYQNLEERFKSSINSRDSAKPRRIQRRWR